LRRVVHMQVRALRTSWRSTEAPNYQIKTLKNFMLSSWNGNGAPRIRTDLQLPSKLRLTKSKSGRPRLMSPFGPQRSSAEGRLRERSGIFRTVNETKGGNVG
jgi:hypothetical protein